MDNNYITKGLYTCMGALCIAPSLLGQTRPNVLIIMTDEHNFRTLGCYRDQLSPEEALVWGENAIVETPHIDKLASMGALCNNYYAVNPVSSPSRAVFITGMYPQTNKVISNNICLSQDMITFAETLHKDGYATSYLGKWHLDGTAKPGWAPELKFGFQDNRYMYNRGHWKKFDDTDGTPKVAGFNDKGKPSESALSGADDKSFATDFLTDRAIKIMNTSKENKQPFCCFLSIADPHGPNIVREPYSSKYNDMVFKRPVSADADVTEMPQWAQKATMINSKGLQQYYGMVSCIDDNVGKILTYLEEEKLLDNTIIIFTSDHGDLLGEHSRDNKSVPYEASAKIPFLWVYPGKIAENKIINKPMNNADFTPTLLGMLKADNDMKYQGRDYSKEFLGKSSPEGMAVFKGKGWLAATNGKRKLIYSSGEGESPVLFDLEKDPHEMNNYYAEKKYTKEISELATFIQKYCTDFDEPLWTSHEAVKKMIIADSSK